MMEMKKLPLLPKLLLCLMFLLAIGQEVAFGGWISSYSVLADITDKEFATIFGIVFQNWERKSD